MFRLKCLLIPALAVALLISCSDKPTEPSHSYSKEELVTRAQEVYTSFMAGRLPASGSPTDALPRADFLPDIMYDTTYDIYVVVNIWGTVNRTDWSGSLKTNGENRIELVRLIDFEEGEDGLAPILATYDPTILAWHSITDGDIDGILTLFAVKRIPDYISPPFVAPKLRFETTPVTEEWYAEELADFADFYPVTGGGMAIVARKLPRPDCRSGTLVGTWTKSILPGDSGQIGGWWVDEQGDTTGSFGGQFWTTEEGRRLFKFYISAPTATVVLGEAWGFWYYDDPSMCPMCGEGHGILKGGFRMGDQAGVLRAEFGEIGLPFDQKELELSGEWHIRCRPWLGTAWSNDR